jgi:hypothetical protein
MIEFKVVVTEVAELSPYGSPDNWIATERVVYLSESGAADLVARNAATRGYLRPVLEGYQLTAESADLVDLGMADLDDKIEEETARQAAIVGPALERYHEHLDRQERHERRGPGAF